ncbi:MAG: hypothetical protein ACLP41_08860 [Acidimicrobiales bacterium]
MPTVRPGALLVRLRAPEADSEPVGPLCDVGDVESHQLAPAKCPRESEQEERPVATPCPVGGKSLQHRAQVGHSDGAHLALGGAEGPAHATTY